MQWVRGNFIHFSFSHILPCLASSQAIFTTCSVFLSTSIDLAKWGSGTSLSLATVETLEL